LSLPQSLWQLLEERGALETLREALPQLPPTDGVVAPEEYRLGPGDVLAVHVLAPVVQTHRVSVSATGDILVPRLGVLTVHGKSLAEVRRELQQRIQQRNPEASLELQLLVPRQVLVTVGGYVRFPGVYVLPASVRVSTAIRMAMRGEHGGSTAGRRPTPLGEVQSLQEIQARQWESSAVPPLPSYCTRNVLLRFSDGRLQTADLERGRALGDGAADPAVSEGLEIIVPAPPAEGYPTVSIGGAVRQPLRVAYRPGDRLSFLLRLAGGVREGVEGVVWVYPPGQPPQQAQLDTTGRPTPDLELTPGSAVVVPEHPSAGLERRGIVHVVGAVARPGAYVIEPGRTRLRELLERAGGVTARASLPHAYIERVPARELALSDPRLPAELELYRRFLYSDLRLEDTVRYALDMRLQRSLVAVDFVALLRHGDARHDVPLEDGDLIVIPHTSATVAVWGQVHSPGLVPFEPGKPARWYIEHVGGYAVGADPRRVRVLRGATRTWLTPEQAGALQPGDEIYVPRRLDVPAWAQQQAELQLYTVLVGAASTLTFIVTTILNLLRR